MVQGSEFDWHESMRPFTARRFHTGYVRDLPPHVRQRVLAVVDPVDIVVGDVSVSLDEDRSATGGAVFATKAVFVCVLLKSAPWDGRDGGEVNVTVRSFVELECVAVTGGNGGWAPDQWKEAPVGQYRFRFRDDAQVHLPLQPGSISPELREFVVQVAWHR